MTHTETTTERATQAQHALQAECDAQLALFRDQCSAELRKQGDKARELGQRRLEEEQVRERECRGRGRGGRGGGGQTDVNVMVIGAMVL